ncbi:MAG: Maf family protein [Phycisphaerales bacterium]
MAQDALDRADLDTMTFADTQRDARGLRLVLATRSARRRRLLKDAGVRFAVAPPAVDDGPLTPGDATPRQWAASLALLKAEAARRAMTPKERADALVLGADTIVVARGAIIGQPEDRADAERIIRLLASGSHTVVTGAALVEGATGRRAVLVDSATVQVGAIEDASLASYLDSGEWRGKAGAYNLSERLEAGWPIEFEGDPATIMGLPMRRLLPILHDALTGAAFSGRDDAS